MTESPTLFNIPMHFCSRGEGQASPLVEQFVARKADILFSPAWKTAKPKEEEHEEEEEAAG